MTRQTIDLENYLKLKEQIEGDEAWEEFLEHVRDPSVIVIVTHEGRDHLKILFDPEAPMQVDEMPV
jgi:hypothetical protein